jgi:hypothetical protein
VQPSELGTFTGQFMVTWPGGQSVTQPARLDTAKGSPTYGDFTATVTVPQNLNGSADLNFTGASPGVQGVASTSFPVRPGGGIVVTLANTSGRTVSPGGTLQINGTIDANGQAASTIIFVLAGLGKGVEASLKSPPGKVPVHSGQQQISLTISVGPKARLGPATGTIQWAPAPAGQGTPPPSDFLAATSLDLTIAFPAPPLTSHPWFWLIVGLAVAVFLVLLAWRLRIRQAIRVHVNPLAAAGPDVNWDLGSDSPGHWDPPNES